MPRQPDAVVRLAAAGEEADQVVTVVGDQVLVATPADVGKVVTVAADGTLVFDDAAGGGVSDHGALTGLADDDHSQYATDAALTTHAGTTHGVTDHGALTGLADDDHPYVLESLIDAAGDLLVGTAADTAGRLAMGSTALKGLHRNAGGTALEWAVPAGRLLAVTQYNPASLATLTTTSTTFVDVDATNLAVAFVVPDSGVVLVRLVGEVQTTGGAMYWNLREGGSSIASSHGFMHGSATTLRLPFDVRIPGLTPGASLTYKWGWRVASGTGTLYAGSNDGPAVMEVWAAV